MAIQLSRVFPVSEDDLSAEAVREQLISEPVVLLFCTAIWSSVRAYPLVRSVLGAIEVLNRWLAVYTDVLFLNSVLRSGELYQSRDLDSGCCIDIKHQDEWHALMGKWCMEEKVVRWPKEWMHSTCSGGISHPDIPQREGTCTLPHYGSHKTPPCILHRCEAFPSQCVKPRPTSMNLCEDVEESVQIEGTERGWECVSYHQQCRREAASNTSWWGTCYGKYSTWQPVSHCSTTTRLCDMHPSHCQTFNDSIKLWSECNNRHEIYKNSSERHLICMQNVSTTFGGDIIQGRHVQCTTHGEAETKWLGGSRKYNYERASHFPSMGITPIPPTFDCLDQRLSGSSCSSKSHSCRKCDTVSLKSSVASSKVNRQPCSTMTILCSARVNQTVMFGNFSLLDDTSGDFEWVNAYSESILISPLGSNSEWVSATTEVSTTEVSGFSKASESSECNYELSWKVMQLWQQCLVDLEIQQNATCETESKFHTNLSAWHQLAASHQLDPGLNMRMTIIVLAFGVVIFPHFLCMFAVIYNGLFKDCKPENTRHCCFKPMCVVLALFVNGFQIPFHALFILRDELSNMIFLLGGMSYDTSDFTGGYRRLERMATALVGDIPQVVLQSLFYWGGYSDEITFELWLFSVCTSLTDFTLTLHRMRREWRQLGVGWKTYVVRVFTDVDTGYYLWPLTKSSPVRSYTGDEENAGARHIPSDHTFHLDRNFCLALLVIIVVVGAQVLVWKLDEDCGRVFSEKWKNIEQSVECDRIRAVGCLCPDCMSTALECCAS